MAKYDLRSEFIATNAEGIQKIPQEWQIKQVRYLLKDGAEGIKIGPFGSALKLEDMVEEGFSVYGQENVIKKDFTLGKRKISETKFQEMSVYRIFPKDILITMMGTSGKCEIVPKDVKDGIIDSHLLRVRVKENHIIPEFFKLLIDESPEIAYQIQVFGKGSIMHGLNSGIVKSLNLPLPSIAEQKHILSFLDHETAKIDSLIAKQQKLIELLKEKRQAVISHAVTKGLNPDVAMKDSGVEWLGQVPEHWVVSFIKYILAKAKDAMVDGPFGSSVNTATDYVEDGIPVIRTVNITNQGFSSENLKFMRISKFEELKRHSVKTGDVLFSKVGTIGNACIFPENMGVGILSTTGSCKISINEDLIDRDFLVFQIHCMNQELTQIANANVQPFLNMTNIKNLRISLPSLDEQKSIISLLKSKLDSFDRLIAKAESAIQLMQERRTALISSAVTGKIDVRNWQHPNEAKTELSP